MIFYDERKGIRNSPRADQNEKVNDVKGHLTPLTFDTHKKLALEASHTLYGMSSRISSPTPPPKKRELFTENSNETWSFNECKQRPIKGVIVTGKKAIKSAIFRGKKSV